MKKQKILIRILLGIIVVLVIVMFNQNSKLNKMTEIKEQLSTEDGFITTSEHMTQMAEQNVGKKVIELGSGTSFDLSSYEGYEKFTEKNFIILTKVKATTSGSLLNGLTGASLDITTGEFEPLKTYNTSTGKLTISNLSKNITKSPVGTTGGGTVVTNITLIVTNVYLVY